MAEEYTDIMIRILPWDGADNTYHVEASLNDGMFLAAGELREPRIDLARLPAAQLDAKRYGMVLFDALLLARSAGSMIWPRTRPSEK